MALETTDTNMAAPVRCEPLPGWVELTPFPTQISGAADDCIGDGLCRLLNDVQVDVRGSELAFHTRIVQRVLTRAGAERVAHFVAEFDPAHQRQEVHFIRVHRDGQLFDHARVEAFQIFRRETGLERMMLDGRLTTSMLIPDVRVGDVIEVGLTVYDRDRPFGQRLAAWVGFDCFHPWLESRYRLLRPLDREIVIKPVNGPPERQIIRHDGFEEWRWCFSNQRRRQPEPLTPPWLVVAPAVQLSEFRSWNEVARLSAPLYEGGQLPGELIDQIDLLDTTYKDPKQRAVEWLRFVQQKLRYFALSLGQGGWVPRDPKAIWESGFGDCKDATRLYIAGAQRLGLQVSAALVSTRYGLALNEFLPSPNLFDHCIVRLTIADKIYWIDPTMRSQSGSLDNLFQPHAGWALPLKIQTEQLEKLGTQTPLNFINLDDEIRFGSKRSSPVRLRRAVQRLFGAADEARNRIADESAASFADAALNHLRATWPNVVETEPMEIRDDQVKNCLTTIHSFEIRDGWKPSEKSDYVFFPIGDPLALGGELSPINDGQRQTDIYLGRPRRVTRRVMMQMPREWPGNGYALLAKATGLRFVEELDVLGRTIICTQEFEVSGWSAPPSDVGKYIEVTGRLQQQGTSVLARDRSGQIRGPQHRTRIDPRWIGWMAFWLVMLALMAAVRSIGR